MASNTKDLMIRIGMTSQAWAKLCPEKSFSGLTLEQFRGSVKPSFDVRALLHEYEVGTQAAVLQRKTVDAVSLAILQRVVNAVKGDPEAGEDSQLYAAMGFVPKSQRSTGLTRRRTKEEVKTDDNAA